MNIGQRAVQICMVLLVVVGSIDSVAQAQEHATKEHDIAIGALPLMAAVKQLSDETGVEVLYFSDIAEGVTSSPVEGTLTAKQALDAMLVNVDLEVVELDNSDAVAIRPKGEQSAEGKVRPASSPILMAQSETPAARQTPTNSTSDVGDETTANVTQLDEILVTGTRIRGAELTAQTVSISKEDFDARGITSLEQLMAVLPQTYGLVNSANTTPGAAGNTLNPSSQVSNPRRYAGTAAANLRGLGSSNVLILVNGRRQAVSAAFEGDTGRSGVNLNSIPFSAIERVEIILDGASSIYGSDAIGGVINFILRKDYQGAELSARYGNGANGGDNYRLEGSYGHTWSTGNFSATASFSEDDEILAADAGFTSQDQRSIGGIDGRSISPFVESQPGRIFSAFEFAPGLFFADQFLGQLVPGDNGTTPLSAADLAGTSGRLSTAALPYDNPAEVLRGKNERFGFSLTVEQQLSERVELFFDALYSRDQTELRFDDVPVRSLLIPTTNAFNDTGQALFVSALLDTEADNGVIPTSVFHNENERIGITLGTQIDIGSNWELQVTAGYNDDSSDFTSDSALLDLAALQALADSDDPAVAFNPFGDGSAQNDLSSAFSVGAGLQDLSEPSTATLKSIEVLTEGRLSQIAGGDVRLAVGAEFRDEEQQFGAEFADPNAPNFSYSVSNPKRDVLAGFLELNIPLVGKANAIPAVAALQVNVSGRYDRYETNVSGSDTNNDFSAFSPRLGVAWHLTDDLRFRANWGEAFRAPTLTQLYPAESVTPIPGFLWSIFDPFYPGGDPFLAPPSTLTSTVNNNLEGETSESWSAGIGWYPELFGGQLELEANYNHTDINDQINTSLVAITDPSIWTANFGPEGPENSITRDANGFVVDALSFSINIDALKSETLDLRAAYTIESVQNGTFTVDWMASQMLRLDEIVYGVPRRLDGTDSGPPEWTHVLGFYWDKGDFGANLIVNYRSEYDNLSGLRDILFLSERQIDEFGLAEEVDSYTTVDVNFRYDFEDLGTEFTFGIADVFDEDFPFRKTLGLPPFDLSTVDPRGRRIYLQLRTNFDL